MGEQTRDEQAGTPPRGPLPAIQKGTPEHREAEARWAEEERRAASSCPAAHGEAAGGQEQG